ncbi:MAG: cell wall hydrolase, partial [Lachnospiraceae bacterium]|nr:cell wall hydrolase [Lachnospiraceae bacterium]
MNAEAAWTENSDGTYSWYTDSGKLATSKWIQGKYYVNAKGIRVTGLQKISGKYYFFSKTTGELICGTWIKSDGKYYYAKSNGVLYTSCIKEINGSYYYFNAKGYRKTGKQTVDGNTYYFKKSNGKMVISKWVCISNKYYYFGTDGVMVTSAWVGRYYVNSNGVRVTSTWVGNKYVDSDGKCVSGLQLINGSYYYFDTTTYEKVTSQSVTVGEYTYTFDSSGVGTITSAYGREAATIAVEDSYYTDELVDDETLLAALIYCEAGNQSYTGMLAVGLVVLNRVNNPNIPGTTMREVIYAVNQFTPSANDNLTKALNGTLKVHYSSKTPA